LALRNEEAENENSKLRREVGKTNSVVVVVQQRYILKKFS